MKKNQKNIKKNSFAPEKILKKNNADVLVYIDEIKNETEKRNVINGLINYLESCLLDRDAGKPGSKLIDQLRERLNKNDDAGKEYKLEDLIWWKGTEVQIEYLFSLLIKKDLIDKTQFNERFSLIAKHFRNEKGNRFKNKQLSQAVRNVKDKYIKGWEILNEIVNETKIKN